MESRENLESPQSPLDSPHARAGRKSSLISESSRRTSVQDQSNEHQQSTSEMFKDMLSQKRQMILSKLTSFDSEVSRNVFCMILFVLCKHYILGYFCYFSWI